MKLAVYIRSVKTARGAEQTVATVASGLAARGHEVHLLVEEGEGRLLEELETGAHPVRVVRLREARPTPVRRARERALQVAALARALAGAPREAWAPLSRLALGDDPPLAALRDHLRRERPASLLSFLNYPNAVTLLLALLGRGETRFLVNVRNQVSVSSALALSRWNRSIPLLMRALFRHADGVVAPSRGVAEDVVRLSGVTPDRVTVIHNPVVRPELLERARERPAHPWLEDGGPPVVLGAGKLKPQKDFATLLRAFARVRRARPARLVILGEGDERPKLEALARERGVADDVSLPGYVPNPWACFRCAAAFVLSSAWEGLPNVLIEAMACGCPVASTDCPSGPAEILEQGAHGPLVPVGDEAALARAIERLLDEPPERERLIEAAARYSFDASIEAYEAIMTGRPSSASGRSRAGAAASAPA
jgi:glycosyltransferase involved in cell wall biosynthesis